MYEWRRMSEEERQLALKRRRSARRPLHGPPHEIVDRHTFHLTAACYEHAPVIDAVPCRVEEFAGTLLNLLSASQTCVHAWCVLPNHYHLLVTTPVYPALALLLGRFHGGVSRQWNKEEGARGRKIWHRHADRAIRSDGHYWAALNYIHHNPVRHKYVERWCDWPWSSAQEWLHEVGDAEAARVWRMFPILDFGRGWDDP